jgi:iron(III) transport system permease protein
VSGALLVVAALLGWPLAAVLVNGLTAPPPSVALLRDTLAVALASTLGALALAAVLVVALRAGIAAGLLVTICRVGVLLPSFVVPLALLALAVPPGLGAIVLAQTFAFLPHAFALLARALTVVPAELEQAAELLGASRWTIARRVTLGLAGPRVGAAALVVLGLCLADVATPLLVGGDRLVLASAVVGAAARGHQAAVAGAALALGVLTAVVALVGRTWHHAGALASAVAPPRGLPVASRVRGLLGVLAGALGVVLVGLWALVPLASLGATAPGGWRPSLVHWTALTTGPTALALVHSLVLALAVAVVATAVALASAWLVERRRGAAGGTLALLARLPVAVPGVVGGVGYLLAFGAPTRDLALAALVVAAWELPLTLRVAGGVLARRDRATEQAALTLGAGRLTTFRRVVLPGLRPAAAWIVGHGFAAGVVAVGTVIVLAGPGLELGAVHMLAAASTGSVGAACAVATVLLALAGGATLLGRAVAGRESVPTLLA